MLSTKATRIWGSIVLEKGDIQESLEFGNNFFCMTFSDS